MPMGGDGHMRHYEILLILDPIIDDRAVTPTLDTLLKVVSKDGGKIAKIDIWGKRRLAYEIAKKSEGIYAVVNVDAQSSTVQELDRQLSLNEKVLRTKVMRLDA